jgi:hypothetical protein
MSDRTYAKVQTQQKTLSGSSPRSSNLQRTCACGQHTIAGAECSTCRSGQSTLHRSQRAFEPPSAPGAVPGSFPAKENGTSFNSAFDKASRFGHDFSQIPIHSLAAGAIQTKLVISKPGDEHKVADVPEEMRSDRISPPVALARQFDFTRIPLTVPTIQRKLTFSSPGDLFEREADDVAEKVMRMAELVPTGSAHAPIQRKCAECEDEEKKPIQTKPTLSAHTRAALDANAAVRASERGGAPLSREARSYFEPRFGYDFSRVRVHADGAAAHGARAVCARAYTIGRDIVFASGEYAPAKMEGKRLLAHELAHVVQQGHSRRRDDSLTRGFMENEAARVKTLTVRSYHPALDKAVPQKQRAQVRLSTRSIGESPAVVSRQKTSPDETSGNQPGSDNKPKDRKQISKDLCINEPIDDTKARCQFSSGQLNMVRIIKEHSLRTCARAIAAINMPGNEGEVIKIAKDYFHLDIKLSEKTKRTFINAIKAVSDKLEHTAIICGTCQDEHCNGGAIAHVDEARTFLVLCPLFFNSEINKVYLTPRFLIHEAGHLARLDENASLREEFYCYQGATKEEKCPVVDAIHNVDAWSHFIEELASTI